MRENKGKRERGREGVEGEGEREIPRARERERESVEGERE